MNSALIALEAQVRADLAKTAHPDAAWLTPKLGPDNRPALDVLVVGAGQSGLATAFGLMRSQVSNILVLDKSEEGKEGPWLTYARMHTLRSPKHFTGPDLDIPSLTYQSWHEARFGEEDWRNLDLISRELWAEYLFWFRRVLDLPVRNGCEVIGILPASGGLLAAKVQTADGVDTSLHGRSSWRRGRKAWATGSFRSRCAICHRHFACMPRSRSTSRACAANGLR